MKAASITLMAGSALLAGCAQTPNVEINYYHPRAVVQTSVIRTISCSADDRIVGVTSVTAKAVYGRDDRRTRASIKLDDLDRFYANTDVGISFHEDGRLKGVNSAQTGQGGEIIKSALALTGAVASAGILGGNKFNLKSKNVTSPPETPDDRAERLAREKACAFINGVSPKEKMITVTLNQNEIFDLEKGLATASPYRYSQLAETYYEDVRAFIGDFSMTTTRAVAPNGPNEPLRAEYKGSGSDIVKLQLVQPAIFKIAIEEKRAFKCNADEIAEGWRNDTDGRCKKAISNGHYAIPQHGPTYDVAIPKAALFGKQVFSLEIAESGTITAIKYGKESGLAAGMTALTGTIQQFDGDTPAEAAAKLKAETDIIKEQRRQIRCQTNPGDNCN